ncbi:glycoside hydrolase [Winogradskyella thalassocola]|uniref:O-Glycosyl hydrolase n=1 Tax=Winogradskyella thalassocola TaxID=262004 RepID=A0A1G7WFN5_9FLAO|nr:glycoside hydrolase [Winogradskyella thalassocola]SDG70837.1 O-Glycosyl hydrolase [Winogradskyella thalassocola]
MNNIIYKRIFLVLIVFGLVVGCEKDNFTDPNDPRFGSEEVGIVLDLDNTYQVIDHFGASGGFQDQWVGQWSSTAKDDIAKLLFSSDTDGQGNPEGIGLSLWRTVIGDGAADQVNSGFASSSWFRETECYLNANGDYDFTKQAGEQWFLSKAREYGVPKFTAWATTPPYFMTKNGYTFSTSDVSTFNCDESAYGEYSKFIADVIKNYENNGYNFETVCAFNETQYEWNAEIGSASQSGTRATNSEVAAVTRIMDAEFTAQNINAKIMIPEAAQLKYLYEGTGNTTNQINDFFNSSSPNYIGDLPNLSNHIAGHSYFSNGTTSGSLNQRTSLRTALANAGHGLDYWQTEYSLLGADYQQGRDVASLTEIDYALWLTRIIHTDLVFGDATGWSFWTALNQSTYGDHPFRFNLILYQPNSNSPSHTDGSFYDVKNLWALGNFSRFVRPGMVRFEVIDPDYNDTTSVENFMISGYKGTTSNEVVVVCINNTDSNREISFENYGEDFEIVGGSFDMYTTSSTSNLLKSNVAHDAVVIPAKSIVTLTAQLN